MGTKPSPRSYIQKNSFQFAYTQLASKWTLINILFYTYYQPAILSLDY